MGRNSTPESPTVAVSKISEKGVVQIPFEVRTRLGLEPGTKMILVVKDDLIVLQKAESLFERREPSGLMDRLRSVFTRLPIKDLEA